MPDRILIRNGTVLSLAPDTGDHDRADVLVEDGVIQAIALGLPDTDAEVIDATDTIVQPGFVDTHRHTWQAAVRGLVPSCTLAEYFGAVLRGVAPRYRPEDAYAGVLLGAYEALNAGITTLADWTLGETPEHVDAALTALREAGIRALFGYGTPLTDWGATGGRPHPAADARRVRDRWFASDDQLLTYALALRGPGISTPEAVSADWKLARELGARIMVHIGAGSIRDLAGLGLLGPDTLYVHCTQSDDDELALIAGSGGAVAVAPYVELVMGHGRPPLGRLLDQGIRPGLGIDVVTTAPGDMFTQMRTALAYARGAEHGPGGGTLTHRDVLRFATIDGATALGLGDRTGTLQPGKQADIVLIRTDAVNIMPMLDPAATVVSAADMSNVDTVLVGGRIVKRGGRLIGLDLARLRAIVSESRDQVLAGGVR